MVILFCPTGRSGVIMMVPFSSVVASIVVPFGSVTVIG